jgi:hypothetical protein
MPAVKLPASAYTDLRIGAYEDTLQAYRIKLASYKRDRERFEWLMAKLGRNRADIDSEMCPDEEPMPRGPYDV